MSNSFPGTGQCAKAFHKFIYSFSARMQSPLVWFVFMAISVIGAVVAWFVRGRPEKDIHPEVSGARED